MFKRILVPLDGSERAERATAVAARLARTSGGTVILARAVQVQSALTPYFELPAELQQDALKAQEAQATAYLADVTKRAEFAGIPVEIVVRVGPAAWELLAAAQEKAADLIVMCSHGHTGFKRWVLGSVAQHIARQARTPVLILRERGAEPESSHLEGGAQLRVLVALDGSELSEAALAPAVRLAQELSADGGGAVHLLFVANPYDVVENAMTHQTALDAAQTYLASIAQRLRDECGGKTAPAVTWSVATDFDIAYAIIHAASPQSDEAGAPPVEAGTTGSFDVIAMATHGRTGVSLWALGSVTDRVVQSTQLPILIIRPPNKTSTGPESEPVQVPALDSTVNTWPGLL